MGDGFQFLDIILLAMVAGFILLRLRSVLGRRTGDEQQRKSPIVAAGEAAAEAAKVIPFPAPQPEPAAIPPGPAAAGLARIQGADRSFDPAEFVGGAKAAYEMIVGAFAAADTEALKQLLSREVYGDFEAAIRDRAAQGLKQETTLVGITAAEIVEAELKVATAEVTVKFVVELINATRDGKGAVVAGDPTRVETVTDIWTFARDTGSRDPNWMLIATATPQ